MNSSENFDFDNSTYYYNYNIKNRLQIEQDEINLNLYNKINICCYEISKEGVKPFLKFLLVPNQFSNLSFPQIATNDLPMTFLMRMVKMYLFDLFVLSDFPVFEEKLVVDGFYEDCNELYLFLNITDCKIMVNDIYSHSQAWFAIIDEITNNKKVCNLDIDNQTHIFFNRNPEFALLLNEYEEPYEIPLVAFVGKPENKLNFTYVFGETTKDKNAILGPYYYFTNFLTAINDGYKFHSEPKNNCGIVRIAIFMGKTKYIENFPNDEIDTSEIKKERLNDSKLNLPTEQLTMRISDHDGKWSQQFDSCYLGKVTLDNGIYLENTNLYVVKNYNQQVPLSYHFINKSAVQNSENNVIQSSNYIV